MIKLTSDSVKTVSSFPEPIAFSFAEMLADGQTDQLVPAVSKPALGSIVAISKFRVSLAKLSFMLRRIGFEAAEILFSILATVTFGGSRLLWAKLV